MAFVAIDVVEVSRRSNGWFRRLCKAYVVEQLRHAKTEMRQLNHLRAIPTEDERRQSVALPKITFAPTAGLYEA